MTDAVPSFWNHFLPLDQTFDECQTRVDPKKDRGMNPEIQDKRDGRRQKEKKKGERKERKKTPREVMYTSDLLPSHIILLFLHSPSSFRQRSSISPIPNHKAAVSSLSFPRTKHPIIDPEIRSRRGKDSNPRHPSHKMKARPVCFSFLFFFTSQPRARHKGERRGVKVFFYSGFVQRKVVNPSNAQPK
jgi:hypothetical protein